MFLTYNLKDLPAGAFASDEARKHTMMYALSKYYGIKTGKVLTQEIAKTECKVIQSLETDPSGVRPELSLYHNDLPVVRLYNRNGEYELQVLDPNSSEYDIISVLMFDEVGRNAVPANHTT